MQDDNLRAWPRRSRAAKRGGRSMVSLCSAFVSQAFCLGYWNTPVRLVGNGIGWRVAGGAGKVRT